jgi:hypothetical protein
MVYNYNGNIPTLSWDALKPLLKNEERIKFEAKAGTHDAIPEMFQAANVVSSSGETSGETSEDDVPATPEPKEKKSMAEVLASLPPPPTYQDKKQANSQQSNLLQLKQVQDAFSLARIKGMGDYKTGTWKRLTLAIATACGNEAKDIWKYISNKEKTNWNEAHNDKIWEECFAMKVPRDGLAHDVGKRRQPRAVPICL